MDGPQGRARGIVRVALVGAVALLAFLTIFPDATYAQLPIATTKPGIPTPTPTPFRKFPTATPTPPYVIILPEFQVTSVEIHESLLVDSTPQNAIVPITISLNKNSIAAIPEIEFDISLTGSDGVVDATWNQRAVAPEFSGNTAVIELELSLTAYTPLDVDSYTVTVMADPKHLLSDSDRGDNLGISSPKTLLHTSGVLWFGAIETTLENVTSLTASPLTLNGSSDYSGQTVSFTSLTVKRSSTTLDLTTVSGQGTIADIDPHVGGDWSYRLSDGKLDSGGASADLAVYLPQTVSHRLDSYTGTTFRTDPIDLGNQALDRNVGPQSSSITIADPIRLYSEGIPLYFNGDSAVFSPTDGLSLVNPKMNYVHAGRFSTAPGERPTNDGLFDTALNNKSDVVVTPSGLKTELKGQSETYKPAFPYGSQITHGDVELAIVDGAIDPASSTVASMEVELTSEVSACSGSESSLTSTFVLDGAVSISSDGGLAHDSTLLSSYQFSFNTCTGERLDNVGWYQPGFILHADAPIGALDEVDRYLLAGRAYESEDLYYDGGDTYIAGDGFYAGVNFFPEHLTGMEANAVIAGDSTLGIVLNEGSKFYVRRAGYSGTLDGDLGADSNLEIYPDSECGGDGYAIELTSFGQAYLDNQSEGLDSKINGKVDLPFPSQIEIPFEKMTLNPCGNFTSGQIPEDERGVTRTLAYWLADLTLSTIDFELRDGAASDDDRTLWVSSVNDVDGLGAKPLMQENFRPCGTIAQSRVAEPVDTSFDDYGTTLETLYLSAYNSDDGLTANGFYSFVNSLRVPFFDPPRIHSQIRPESHNLADGSPWDENDRADADGDGWPDDYTPSGSDLTSQMSTYKDNRLVTLQTVFGGVIPLNYEVKYNTSDTTFKSSQSIGQDLLVIDIDSKIKYLNQTHTEITFGLEVEGVPEINFASLADNFGDEIQEKIFDAIRDKLDEVSEKITGDISSFLRPILQDVIEEHVQNALDRIDSTIDAFPDIENVSDIQVDLDAIVNDLMGDIKLQSAFDNSGAGDMLERITQTIDETIVALEEVKDAVQLDVDDIEGLVGELVDLALYVIDSETDLSVDEILGDMDDIRRQIIEPIDEIVDVLNEAKTYLDPSTLMSFFSISGLGTLETDVASDINDYLLDLDVDRIRTMDAEEITNLILDAIFNSTMFQNLNAHVSQVLVPVKEMLYEQANNILDKLNDAVDEFLEEALDYTEGAESALKELSKFKGAEMEGYAVISGDVLEKLHIDASFSIEIPDEMTFAGYLDVTRYDVESAGKSCFDAFETGEVLDIRIGATGIELNWGTSDLSADIEFALMLYNGVPVNVGGSIITEGELNFETVVFRDLGFGISVGAIQNYIWAMGSGEFNSIIVDGGIFLGTSCTLEPLEIIDPDVASLLTIDEMSGVFAKVGASFPIYNYGCIFRIAAEAEIGAWYFANGPTYGGKLVAGAYGEGLCVVAVKGTVTLIGGRDGDSYFFNGEAWVAGGIGDCEPEEWDSLGDAFNDKWCYACGARVELTYKQEEWDVDYDASCND